MPRPSERNEKNDPDGGNVIERVLRLHTASGEQPVKERVWERELPDGWYLACNGFKEHREVEPKGGMRFNLAPFTFGFWFNGWFAGELRPYGDGFIAAGEAANLTTLVAALDKALADFPADLRVEERPK